MRFGRRFGLAATVLTCVAAGLAVTRNRQLTWGADQAEILAELPGDGMLGEASLVATRAITVGAPVDRVWPWVAQLGQGRGGFYSYDRLENLAGCRIQSADRIEPAWQYVAIGDEFRLHPEVVLRVVEVDPPRSLVVLGGSSDLVSAEPDGEVRARAADSGTPAAAAPYDFTWAFVLQEREPGMTRLLVRERYRPHGPAVRVLVELLSTVSFIMTQRMLRGIRDRAQAAMLAEGSD